MFKKKTPETSEKEEEIIKKETQKYLAELNKIYPNMLFLGAQGKYNVLDGRGCLGEQVQLLVDLFKKQPRLLMLTLFFFTKDTENADKEDK